MDFDNPLVFLSSLILFILLTLGLIITGATKFDEISCANYAQATGRETKFQWIGGCFTKSNDQWLSLGEYKAVIIAREGLKN